MSKSFEQIGTETGELVAQKNAAYGSSFAKAGEFLRLLYPNGLRPDQMTDALLLVRMFDKQVRIATAPDAFGESPYQDLAGYAILGVHLNQERRSAAWQDSANGPDAANPPKAQPDSVPQPTKPQTTPNVAEPSAPSSSPSSSASPASSSEPASTSTSSALALLAPELASAREVVRAASRNDRNACAFPSCLGRVDLHNGFRRRLSIGGRHLLFCQLAHLVSWVEGYR